MWTKYNTGEILDLGSHVFKIWLCSRTTYRVMMLMDDKYLIGFDSEYSSIESAKRAVRKRRKKLGI